jgi:hypothetical protein
LAGRRVCSDFAVLLFCMLLVAAEVLLDPAVAAAVTELCFVVRSRGQCSGNPVMCCIVKA